MNQYVYLSATPESLIASHLPPYEFGNYLAVGAKKRARGQAIYFDVDTDKLSTLPEEYLKTKLVPYESGEPKRSVYLSIYRSLEQTPLEALKNLYLVTDDGKVLQLESTTWEPEQDTLIYLYQQFIPISTRVASKLTPPEFIGFLTDPGKPVSAPRIFMADLKLNKLARHPDAPIHDLPYPNPDHLRDCLARLMASEVRLTKTVIRQFKSDLSYRTVQRGFCVGDQEGYPYFPMPSIRELESTHYSWWRSALNQGF
jgi:hypothetical protein